MKIQLFFILIFCAATDCYSQASKDNDYTNVYHYLNNISVSNFDGSRSLIYINGSSASLVNTDGTRSTINFCGNSSTLIALDGTSATVFHNGPSSILDISDGTQIIVNHSRGRSSCFTENGNHNIMHTYGSYKEKRYKSKIDVLIHLNWFIMKNKVKKEFNREVNLN